MRIRAIPEKIRHIHPFADILLVTVVLVLGIELAIGMISPEHDNYRIIIGVLVVSLLMTFITEAGVIYRRMKNLGSPRKRKEAIVGSKGLRKALWVVPVIFVPLVIATQRLVSSYPSLPMDLSSQSDRIAFFMYVVVITSWLLGIVSVYVIYRFTKTLSQESED